MTDDVAAKIQENFEKFEHLIDRIDEPRREAVKKMVAHYAERLAVCPASSRVEYHNAFPGGLVEHSLRVFKFAVKITKALGYDDLPMDSLIIAALFHDFGKVGDFDNDRYLPQKSDWHRDHGMMYDQNKKAMLMPVPQQGLFNMQQFGIELSKDEYLGILLHDGQYAEENRPYRMKEPKLSLVMHHADRLAAEEEKELDRKSL